MALIHCDFSSNVLELPARWKLFFQSPRFEKPGLIRAGCDTQFCSCCMAYRTITLSGNGEHPLSGMWMGVVWQW